MPSPSVPINNVQERVERSLFEAIREKLVNHGYLPEVSAYSADQVGNDDYIAAKKAIVTNTDATKPDSIDVFGHGSELSKGIEATPRIVCVTRRIMPGDIGKKIDHEYWLDPLDPDSVIKTIPPYKSTNLHIDIEVVSRTARQDRIMNAILAEAIGGAMGYVNVYDTTTKEKFFIRQFNFYDVPDTENGIIKKVYSYEIPDLYLTDGMTQANYPLIEQITVLFYTIPSNRVITQDDLQDSPSTEDSIVLGIETGDFNSDFNTDFLT